MEFRKMRRSRQELSFESCTEILNRNTHGILAVIGEDGYPYAVPLSYVYADNCIYIHCAKSGHKLDAIRYRDKVSFCVVDQDQVVPEEYTSYYRSVILFGRAEILSDENEIYRAIDMLAKKYFPGDTAENRKKAIDKEISAMAMLRIRIDHISGKEAKELLNKK